MNPTFIVPNHHGHLGGEYVLAIVVTLLLAICFVKWVIDARLDYN